MERYPSVFNVGDKVQICNRVNACIDIRDGRIFDSNMNGEYKVIKAIDTPTGRLKFEGMLSRTIWYDQTCFRLIKRAEKEVENEIQNNEVTKMKIEDIKDMNLKEAKKQAEKEIMNEEIEFAKQKYREVVDTINKIDRDIKELQERKAETQKKYKKLLGK